MLSKRFGMNVLDQGPEKWRNSTKQQANNNKWLWQSWSRIESEDKSPWYDNLDTRRTNPRQQNSMPEVTICRVTLTWTLKLAILKNISFSLNTWPLCTITSSSSCVSCWLSCDLWVPAALSPAALCQTRELQRAATVCNWTLESEAQTSFCAEETLQCVYFIELFFKKKRWMVSTEKH